MNLEELRSLKRHDLQKKAKQYGIKANQSSQALIEQILEKSAVFYFHLILCLRYNRIRKSMKRVAMVRFAEFYLT